MHNDLHVTGIWLKNFLTWEKRLLIRTVFVLTVLKTELSTWSSIAEKARVSFVAYLHVSAAFVAKQKSLGWSKTSKRKWTFDFLESIGRKDKLNIHRWKENNVTYYLQPGGGISTLLLLSLLEATVIKRLSSSSM